MAVRRDLQRRRRINRSPRTGRPSIAAISAALCITLCTPITGGSARAQSTSEQAEALFRDGSRLLADGKIARACEAFEASNRLEPRAGTLISLGACREQNGQWASAWSAYKQALARVKDPRKREFATARAAALEPRLSYLVVAVPEQNRIEGLVVSRGDAVLPPVAWNQPQPVDGGDYAITARAPGRDAWHGTVHVAASGARVQVEVPWLDPVNRPSSPPGPVTAEDASSAAPRGSPGWLTLRRKVALGIAGASVAGVLTAVALGVSANGKEDEAFRLCPDPAAPCQRADDANALLASSHRRASAANAVFGVAAAAAIAAGVLWVIGGPGAERSPSQVSVVPSWARGESSVAVRGRF